MSQASGESPRKAVWEQPPFPMGPGQPAGATAAVTDRFIRSDPYAQQPGSSSPGFPPFMQRMPSQQMRPPMPTISSDVMFVKPNAPAPATGRSQAHDPYSQAPSTPHPAPPSDPYSTQPKTPRPDPMSRMHHDPFHRPTAPPMDDPYAQQPGTPHPAAQAQDHFGARPSPQPQQPAPYPGPSPRLADPFVSTAGGGPKPQDPFMHAPGAPPAAADPYAHQPGTPHPSAVGAQDPYAQPPNTPRPMTSDPYGHQPGTGHPGPHGPSQEGAVHPDLQHLLQGRPKYMEGPHRDTSSMQVSWSPLRLPL